MRWADEYDVGGRSPQQCRRVRQVIDHACQRHHRDPRTVRLSCLGTCLIGRDQRELHQRARNLTKVRGEWGTHAGRLIGTLEQGWIAGTPRQVEDHLSRLADAAFNGCT